jgi:menaquinone-dependent protoporphyrinogen oxidase
MSALIAVASRHGSTREIAEAIADEFRKHGLQADTSEAKDVTNLDGYSVVVIGSAIYMGGWMPAAIEMVERVRPQLEHVPVWLFSSGPLGAEDPQPDGDPRQLLDLLQATNAQGHHIFTGKLDRHELGLGEKMIARMVHAPEGDFRDWDEIRGWVREIVEDLVSPAEATS